MCGRRAGGLEAGGHVRDAVEFLELPFDEQAGQSVGADDLVARDAQGFAFAQCGDEQEPPDDAPSRVGFGVDEHGGLSGGEGGDLGGRHPVLLDRVHGVAADDAFGDGGLACLGQDGVGQGGRGGGFALDAFRGVSFEAVAFDEAYVGGFEPVHAYGADDGGDVVFDAEPV